MPCAVTASLTELLLTPESENDGNIRLLHCDMQITLHCEAVCTAEAALLTDIYSTVHPLTAEAEDIPLLTEPAAIAETMQMKPVLSKPEAVLTRVYAAWARPACVRAAADADGTGGTVLTGTLRCCVLAADEGDHPMMLEQEEPFSWPLPQVPAGQLLPQVRVSSCGYTLTGSDSVTLQAELSLSGTILRQSPRRLLTDVTVDSASRLPANEDYALRLYFGQPEESLWEIAKRYHTAPEAVREENALAEDTLKTAQMLLIPNVK